MTTTKICPICKEEKDLDRFIKPSLWRCKDCENRWLREHRRQKREAYLAEHPKPIRTSKPCKICGVDKPFEDFYFANRAKGIRSSYCKKCQVKIGDVKRTTERDFQLRKKCSSFKTTVQWFYEQREKQDFKCAICGQPETHPTKKGGPVRSLAIDHDHKTGRVRGLLCFRCNTSIHLVDKHGFIWLENAARYLKET